MLFPNLPYILADNWELLVEKWNNKWETGSVFSLDLAKLKQINKQTNITYYMHLLNYI